MAVGRAGLPPDPRLETREYAKNIYALGKQIVGSDTDALSVAEESPSRSGSTSILPIYYCSS
jgi:hypothetical protein